MLNTWMVSAGLLPHGITITNELTTTHISLFSREDKQKRKITKQDPKYKYKPVVQLTYAGEYVATYKSKVEAAKILGISITCIARCCNGREGRQTAQGFRWMNKEDYDSGILSSTKLSKPKNGRASGRKVVQLSLSGEYIVTYNSLQEACEAINCSKSQIFNVCNGRNKTTCGYKFMYIEDYNRL